MMSAVPSMTQDRDDLDILQIILKLSNIRPPEWEPQFPFLDPTTVDRVSQSITHIISGEKLHLKKQIMPLVRKWCTGRNKSQDASHSAWIGRSLSVKDSVESVLTACISLIQDDEDWIRRGQNPEQQLALCFAMLGAATSTPAPLHPKAGNICILLIRRILSMKELSVYHHRFLAHAWSFAGVLPFESEIEVLVCMSERSFLGFEREILRLGRRAIRSNQHEVAESFKTMVGSTLLKVCSQSTLVFQRVCDLLTHMMVISCAHHGVQALTKSFISGVEDACAQEKIDLCTLYDKTCQIVSALLCIDPNLLPEHGETTLTRKKVLDMLHELPRKKAASLLSHRPMWLLYTF